GIKQGFKVGKNWGAYADFSFFVSKYNDMMEFNFGAFGEQDLFAFIADGNIEDLGLGFSSQNVGETRILGIEIAGGSQGKIGKVPLNILAGYTYVNPIALNWDDELTYINTEGEEIAPGAGAVELLTGLDATNGGAKTYAGASSSNENVLKYRSKHTFMLDISSSYKKADFGISVQYRSWMQNIDYLFVSELFTEEIPEEIQPAVGGIESIESVVNTTAFSGLKRYREKYDGRGTTLIDARIAYNFNDNAKLSLVGKNLLNLTYAIRPSLLGDPMSFALQFNYSFKGNTKKKKSE
ncbi:MAG: TonB-dependent receptor domain-containing protein, partial [Chitinophagales bacterium]